jgi:nicotinamide-nucleotide amidase
MCLSTKLQSVVSKIKKNALKIVTAESCTGGLLTKIFTDIPGSSKWFECGFITYSNESKIKLLNVDFKSLEKFGAVSSQVAKEMAIGALKKSNANFSISITGIAGPDGGTKSKPIGTVYICFAKENFIIKEFLFKTDGSRFDVRENTVNFIIDELNKLTLSS